MELNDSFEFQFSVDSQMYENFIKTFNDKNPLHTDQNFAESYGFKDKVMHGNILNGMLSYFIGELLPVKDVIIMKQDITYRNPVYLNDVVNFSAKVIEHHKAFDVYTFKFKFSDINEGKVFSNGKIQIKILKKPDTGIPG